MKRFWFMALLLAICSMKTALGQELVIDVRSALDGGPPVEARRIQFGGEHYRDGATHQEAEAFLTAVQILTQSSKEKHILLVCNVGVRAKEAQLVLELAGFKNVQAGTVLRLLEQSSGQAP